MLRRYHRVVYLLMPLVAIFAVWISNPEAVISQKGVFHLSYRPAHEPSGNKLVLWFPDPDVQVLVPVSINLAGPPTPKEAIAKLMEGPPIVSELQRAISDRVQLKDVSVKDGNATIDVTPTLFTHGSSSAEWLGLSAFQSTLGQFPEITGMWWTVDGERVKDLGMVGLRDKPLPTWHTLPGTLYLGLPINDRIYLVPHQLPYGVSPKLETVLKGLRIRQEKEGEFPLQGFFVYPLFGVEISEVKQDNDILQVFLNSQPEAPFQKIDKGKEFVGDSVALSLLTLPGITKVSVFLNGQELQTAKQTWLFNEVDLNNAGRTD